MYLDTFPVSLRSLERDELVTVYQLRPDLLDQFLAWSGGEPFLVNGGTAVLLAGSGPISERIVGLGDYGVRGGVGVRAEPASGFWTRYELSGDPE